jgi:hypothetical protein
VDEVVLSDEENTPKNSKASKNDVVIEKKALRSATNSMDKSEAEVKADDSSKPLKKRRIVQGTNSYNILTARMRINIIFE